MLMMVMMVMVLVMTTTTMMMMMMSYRSWTVLQVLHGGGTVMYIGYMYASCICVICMLHVYMASYVSCLHYMHIRYVYII